MAYYPVHQATTHGEDLGTGGQQCATRTRYPVHRARKSGGEGTAQAKRRPGSKEPIRLRASGCRQSRTDLHSAQVNMHLARGRLLRDHNWLFCAFGVRVRTHEDTGKYSAICAECPVGALLGCSLSVIAIVRAQGLSPRCPDRQDRTVQDPPLSSE